MAEDPAALPHGDERHESEPGEDPEDRGDDAQGQRLAALIVGTHKETR